jgi:hypothetical protein
VNNDRSPGVGFYIIRAECVLKRKATQSKVAKFIGNDTDYDIILKTAAECKKFETKDQYCTRPKVKIINKTDMQLGVVEVFWE